MSLAEETAFCDAVAQAELVRKKEITPLELAEAAIGRIERLNPALNAVVTPMFESARLMADNQLLEGPLAGVPFLLKDLLASCAGVRMTSGSRFTKDVVADRDSELVARYKRAGLIIIGKTNTPEFGILPTTEPVLFGPARNPWDTNRTTGGSSGGSAAAVAAGIVPAAHANDGGGSIRIPASCCGIFGMKPTRARNPLGPGLGDMFGGLVAEHVVTRSVRDSAALLDATAGHQPGDPYWAPPTGRPFLDEVGLDPGKLRIAFVTTTATGATVHTDCEYAVRDAAFICSGLGHEVEEGAPMIDPIRVNKAFMTVWAAGCAWTIDGMAHVTGQAATPECFEPGTWALYEMGKRRSAAEYLRAIQVLQSASRQVARFFERFDVWLTPTLAEPPLTLGSFDSPPEDPKRGMQVAAAFAPFTPICNITGQPAMSVPLFWNNDGLPIGSHFVGRFGDEATLFRLAAQLEAARPWSAKRPDLSLESLS
jgi:amidase